MKINVKSLRFFGGFVFGAAASTASCVAALNIYREEILHRKEEEPSVAPEGRYGFPLTGADIRVYANHSLSYDQARRTPRWVAEHLSNEKLLGKADRKHCKFRPDPNVPVLFTAHNDDYLGSGWSRGHMAPAADNKFSEQAMAETFYLSNIVPQNYENNAGFWNRFEMYCRDLTKRFQDVWIISGPLVLPEVGANGKKTISYQVIGKDEVAVPTHLFKVILAQKKGFPSDTLALGAFIVPNRPIGFDHPLTEFQVSLTDLERMSGLTFFPKVDRTRVPLKNLCNLDSCKLLSLKDFNLYIATRKVGDARNVYKLDKAMSELKEAGITPDEYLLKLYAAKKNELASKEVPDHNRGD
ncbi:hypothetical protein COCON_G00066210 [Conger conger]|uniref:Nuclease EXOG, mitochondrial n=1 Tax=Conger conger TaxID=82655 RepID=A0A9Q1DSE1_CONCO|nr:nuclease EXOG, mitochondrial-like [Conger conger]KAJ8279555.1 hypothetical protein COCON_G00066210 [Conger conger]